MKNMYSFIIMTIMMVSAFAVIAPAVSVKSEPLMYILGRPGGGSSPAETIPWGISRINSIEAASMVDESSIKVAIIDTGMDMDHPDLAAMYVWGYDLVNKDTNPDDDNGHGTHCAGTITAIDNSIGVIGVAQVDLYIFKALDRRGSGTYTNIANAIIMATKGPDGTPGTIDDADVISMSLGGSVGTSELETAVNYALSYNVVVVAATGNDGATQPSYPAAYSGVIKVGAVDSSNAIPYWSNDGFTILAPGVNIYSTAKGGGYTTMSGTSMATPHVAGVCALAWAAHPGYSNSQIRTLVENSADSYGIVNALAVV